MLSTTESSAELIKRRIRGVLAARILPADLDCSDVDLLTPFDHRKKIVGEAAMNQELTSGFIYHDRGRELLAVLTAGLGFFRAHPSNPGNVLAQRVIYTFPNRALHVG